MKVEGTEKILHRKFCAGNDPNQIVSSNRYVGERFAFSRENLIAFGGFLLPLLKTLVLSGQNAVQFLDQSLEPFMVLLHRDQRAKFVDSVTVSFVHSDRQYYRIHCTQYVRCRTLGT
jgi:hypothetical protein